MNLEPRNSKKKCIADDCDDCHFFRFWRLTDDHKKDVSRMVCSMDVLCEHIPTIVGAIDGVQEATNITQNRVIKFGDSAVKTIENFLRGVKAIR